MRLTSLLVDAFLGGFIGLGGGEEGDFLHMHPLLTMGLCFLVISRWFSLGSFAKFIYICMPFIIPHAHSSMTATFVFCVWVLFYFPLYFFFKKKFFKKKTN